MTAIPMHPGGPMVDWSVSASTKATDRPAVRAAAISRRAKVVLPVSAEPMSITTPRRRTMSSMSPEWMSSVTAALFGCLIASDGRPETAGKEREVLSIQ